MSIVSTQDATPSSKPNYSSSSLSAQSESELKPPEVVNIRRATSFGHYLATIVLDQQPSDVASYDMVSGGKRRYKVTYSIWGTDIQREVIMPEMSQYDIDFDYVSSQRSYISVKAAGATQVSNPKYFYFDGYVPPRYAMYFNNCDGAVVSNVVVEGVSGGIMALDSTLSLRDSEISLFENYEAYVYEINSTVEESNVRKTIRSE